MSRFDDYCDEEFPNQHALWERAQKLALSGKRGRQVLRELEEALLAMPEKRLISGYLCRGGAVCALGALAVKRKVDLGLARPDALGRVEADMAGRMASEGLDLEDETAHNTIDYARHELGMRPALASAIAFQNDESAYRVSPEERHALVLA